MWGFSGPRSRDIAMLLLQYPISRDTSSVRVAAPQNCAIPPPLGTSIYTRFHLCDTPCCNISRNTCVIPHKSKCERALPRDMKSIAAGRLSVGKKANLKNNPENYGTSLGGHEQCYILQHNLCGHRRLMPFGSDGSSCPKFGHNHSFPSCASCLE